MQLKVRPPDLESLDPDLLEGWEPTNKDRVATNITRSADVDRALPLIRAVHAQFAKNIAFRKPHVQALVRGIREAVQNLGPEVTIQESKAADQYLFRGRDFARMYINAGNVYLMLRQDRDTMDNPLGLGEGKQLDPLASWPANHFAGYFADPAAVEDLIPLIQQAWLANCP